MPRAARAQAAPTLEGKCFLISVTSGDETARMLADDEFVSCRTMFERSLRPQIAAQ